MRLSIIIVNYNVKYFLEQCLIAVEKACIGMDAEIFVVDNNSVDDSVEMVRKRFSTVRLIANKDNKGFSAANNQAIKQAAGDYILLLNPDTVVEEQTFRKVCDFMDTHNDAGGIGVHMIDGKGNFLPESKRGLPTPSVAFYKIFGLAKLFPRSKTFGRYHLGFLDKNETHVVDVLSGAFMLIRKTVLDKIGLLDEDYFMYGEDIDLSYRITKAGYKNYYFPETRIIHYKGESTKKSTVNYVLVFYRAMVIFAKKHFAKGNAVLFSVLINLAIYLRAAAAIVSRFLERIFLPLLDSLIIYGGMFILKNYWEATVKDVHYPAMFMQLVVPVYIFIWMVASYFSGGYDYPVRISRMVRGILSGAVFILVVYALLPESYRFSRALILLGTTWAILSITISRLILNVMRIKQFALADSQDKRLLIVGDAEEGQRILSLLQLSGARSNVIGFVSTSQEQQENYEKCELKKFHLGRYGELNDIIGLYEINEVIFCSKDLSSQEIINQMLLTNQSNVEYKIAPPESLYIIGSNSINERGDLYLVDIQSINNRVNRRNKRLFDLGASVVLMLISPLLIFALPSPLRFIKNWVNVIFGKNSWVGLSQNPTNSQIKFRKGVLTPLDIFNETIFDITVQNRLNALYAKDYKVYNDARIIINGWRNLGRSLN